jgi:hypothetical protein
VIKPRSRHHDVNHQPRYHTQVTHTTTTIIFRISKVWHHHPHPSTSAISPLPHHYPPISLPTTSQAPHIHPHMTTLTITRRTRNSGNITGWDIHRRFTGRQTGRASSLILAYGWAYRRWSNAADSQGTRAIGNQFLDIKVSFLCRFL